MIRIERLTDNTITDEKLEQLLSVLKQLSASVTIDLIKNALSSSQNYVFVAYDDDEHIVGTTTMAFLYCVTGVRVHIEDVVVDEKQRGKGIAQLLIKEAIQRAKEVNAKSIDLTSRPEREAANRLYRKLGFIQRETNVYRYQS
ncbi:acyl-CoA N-acyltransferase [Mycotypha africana]|uniref:acyl-CoA N-acyltransferase n=1 Tax=Mycotypha africana TaxID=64632 RepID=UPI002301B62B|nr:acyl-CoA N-acyltransferase [Mycotypha africana]KAI8987358.1 acyl-CoA N-acyltransferase [Mycotypha africana]